MKSTMKPVFIFVINSQNETNWCFQKKCKNMSANEEIVSDAAFKA